MPNFLDLEGARFSTETKINQHEWLLPGSIVQHCLYLHIWSTCYYYSTMYFSDDGSLVLVCSQIGVKDHSFVCYV